MAGYMTQNGIVVRQGDSFDILLQFRNADGKAINIRDWQIKMSVYDADRKVLKFSKNGEIFDVKEGKARIELKPADTGIDVGDYVTDKAGRLAGFVCAVEGQFDAVIFALASGYPEKAGNNACFFKEK